MRGLSLVAFVLGVLLLLFVLLTRFTNMGGGNTTYELSAFFQNTGGVMEGDPIRMVGKVIGYVSDIRLDPEKRGVRMTLNVDESFKVPKDSYLKIAEKGMLGEMFLSFSFGESKEFYKPGETVKGNPPKGLMDFMGSAEGSFQDGIDSFKDVAEELKKLLSNVNDILEKDEMKESLAETFKALPGALNEAQEMIKENRTAMKDVLVKINELSGEGGSAMKKVNDILAELKDSGAIADLKGTLANTKEMTASLNEAKMAENLNAAIASYKALGEKLNESAEKIDPLFESFKLGHNGTLSKLLHDPTLHYQIEKFLEAGTALVTLLEEQPNSIIFGKRKRKGDK